MENPYVLPASRIITKSQSRYVIPTPTTFQGPSPILRTYTTLFPWNTTVTEIYYYNSWLTAATYISTTIVPATFTATIAPEQPVISLIGPHDDKSGVDPITMFILA